MKHLWQSIRVFTIFSHHLPSILLEAASQRVEAQGATLQAKLLSQLDEAPRGNWLEIQLLLLVEIQGKVDAWNVPTKMTKQPGLWQTHDG